MKLAVLKPAPIVTDEGTVKLVELELRVTTVAATTAELMVTVHEMLVPEFADAGQLRPVRPFVATVTVPLEEASATAALLTAAPALLVSPTALGPTNVPEIVATTPSGMTFPFTPAAIQVYAAAAPAHVTDLPAPIVAGPAATLKFVRFAEG